MNEAKQERPRANAYIGITTPHFKQAAAFYVRHFDFTLNAQMDDFIAVQSPNGKRVLGFNAGLRDAAGAPVFSGGLQLPFLVEDAERALQEFKAAGVAITREIRVESWGEKHFVITDPAGIEVYVSEAMSKGA